MKKDEEDSPKQQDENTPPNQQDEDVPSEQQGEANSPNQQDENTPPNQQAEGVPSEQQDEVNLPDQQDEDTSIRQQNKDISSEQQNEENPHEREDEDNSFEIKSFLHDNLITLLCTGLTAFVSISIAIWQVNVTNRTNYSERLTKYKEKITANLVSDQKGLGEIQLLYDENKLSTLRTFTSDTIRNLDKAQHRELVMFLEYFRLLGGNRSKLSDDKASVEICISKLKKIIKDNQETLCEKYPSLLAENLLQRIYLKEAALDNADLSRSDLRGSNFYKSTFIDANLQGANLSIARLPWNGLRTLPHQLFKRYQPTNLERAQLMGANLREANLREAKLKNADLSKADLSFNLISLNPEKSCFIDPKKIFAEQIIENYCVIRRTNLNGADLTGVDLTGANLTGANLLRSNLNKTQLAGTNMDGVIYDGKTDLPRDILSSDGELKEEYLDILEKREGKYRIKGAYKIEKKAQLKEVNLSGADLTGTDLTGADLTGAKLIDTDLTGAELTGADLTGADLTRVDLTGADLTKAKLIDANLTGADLEGAKLIDADLTGADLTHASLKWSKLERWWARLNKKNLKDEFLNDVKQCNTTWIDGSKLNQKENCDEINNEINMPKPPPGEHGIQEFNSKPAANPSNITISHNPF